MASKTCPSCMEDVPAVASRCKHCFHDFNEEPPKKKGGLLGLMILLAMMGVTGAGFIYASNTQMVVQAETKLDGETQQIIITHVTKDDPPVFLNYGKPAPVPVIKGDGIHHAGFGRLLKEKCEKVGIECHLQVRDHEKTEISSTEFLKRVFTK